MQSKKTPRDSMKGPFVPSRRYLLTGLTESLCTTLPAFPLPTMWTLYQAQVVALTKFILEYQDPDLLPSTLTHALNLNAPLLTFNLYKHFTEPWRLRTDEESSIITWTAPFPRVAQAVGYLCFLPFAVKRWIPIIRQLLDLGADIYERDSKLGTALDALFYNICTHYCSFDSHSVGSTWLNLLRSAGVDVHVYLNNEMRMRPDDPMLVRRQEPSGRGLAVPRQVFRISTKDADPSLLWEWWYDPVLPASHIVNEFKDFSLKLNIEAPGHHGWLRPPFDTFPFATHICEHRYLDGLDFKNHALICQEKARDSARRFEQRQGEKAAKLKKFLRKGVTRRMPGAWVF